MEIVSKSLCMAFEQVDKKVVTIAVTKPAATITEANVKVVTDAIVANPIFGEGATLAFKEAYYKFNQKDEVVL